ncbi:MAG: T9SS type A sorting domain-containing protein [Saprospiraceae bacterium]|nr:T9SS type A sorting domain-containing protein [Saprospiraceae bacterium]
MRKSVLLTLLVPAIIAIVANLPSGKAAKHFHSKEELALFKQFGLNAAKNQQGAHPSVLLPIDSNILFPTAKTCGGCHGKDPNQLALITTSGVDVNIYDDWRSTMMANSAKDPFWRAKVRHEILINPSHSEALQDKCTSCHAPTGNYQSKLHDHKPYYGLADLYADTLGLDGVTCQACHAQAPDKIGQLHSGEIDFDTNYIRVAYGPYKQVFAPPMHDFVGITPTFGGHITDGGVCASCHTLITNTVDLNGQLTGNTFVEQATYHEWLNSRYDRDQENITCQACHMPRLQDEIIISANYQFLTPKFPFGLHELAGANVTMLQLLKNNINTLEINALPEHFDSTIAATLRMLQEKTLDLSLEPLDLNGDTVRFKLTLQNKAGHKFPSGYPSRRAWIEFEVKTESGQTVFHSGRANADFSLPDEDPNLEPHHLVINNPAQVQIYEMVPVDVTGAFTNVLERADRTIKDNRLTPQGFKPTHPAYDTTEIVGHAKTDPDFNRFANGAHGSGSDIVYFSVPNHGYTGNLTVSAKVWYQSLPPKWMASIFEYSAPEIDAFKQMFDAADKSPVLVAAQTLENISVNAVSTQTLMHESRVKVYPSLTSDGLIWIEPAPQIRLKSIEIWDMKGNRVTNSGRQSPMKLPETKGIYFVLIETDRGRVVKKVVRQ